MIDLNDKILAYLHGAEPPAGWQEVAEGFIDDHLRHHRRSLEDVATRSDIRPEIRAAHVALGVADGSTTNGVLQALRSAHQRLAPAEEETAEQKGRIAALTHELDMHLVRAAKQRAIP